MDAKAVQEERPTIMEEIANLAAAAPQSQNNPPTVSPPTAAVEMENTPSDASAMAYAVAAFPKYVPMENEYADDKYSVRACYPEYYGVVVDLLGTKKGVTVTGTPGIGTSVFMGYFFQRYSHDHPTDTVMMASFNRKSVLQQVATARGGKVIKVVRYQLGTVEEIVYEPTQVTDEPLHKAAIWLLDGPPRSIPNDVHWVSFTSPLESWTMQLAKNTRTCATVWMPVWTLDELREAAVELDRTELLMAISDDHASDIGINATAMGTSAPRAAVLDYRFAVFGGIPRVCLEVDRVAIRNASRSFRAAANAVSLDAIKTAMQARAVPVHAHCVLHYEPLEYREAVVRVGSKGFERELVRRGHGN